MVVGVSGFACAAMFLFWYFVSTLLLVALCAILWASGGFWYVWGSMAYIKHHQGETRPPRGGEEIRRTRNMVLRALRCFVGYCVECPCMPLASRLLRCFGRMVLWIVFVVRRVVSVPVGFWAVLVILRFFLRFCLSLVFVLAYFRNAYLLCVSWVLRTPFTVDIANDSCTGHFFLKISKIIVCTYLNILAKYGILVAFQVFVSWLQYRNKSDQGIASAPSVAPTKQA